MNAQAKGYILGSVAAATYGMNPLFALPLYKDGMDVDSVLFFRYLFALPILAAMLKARGRTFRLERRQIPTAILMGLLVAVSSLTLFMSYNYMSSSIASTLLFVYPVLVAIFMALFFKEKLTLLTTVCVGSVAAGIWLLSKNASGETVSLLGALFVFLSATSYAFYIVGVNHSPLKDVATLKVTFYVLLFGVSVFIARILCGPGITTPDHWYLWGNLVALAIFPTTISFLCTTSAIQYIGSTPTAILGALEPVTAIAFGVAVFNEQLSIRECLGIVLIIIAVTLVIAGSSIPKTLMRLRKMFPRLNRQQ